MDIYDAFQVENTLALYLDSNFDDNIGGKSYLIKTKNSTKFYNSVVEKTMGLRIRLIGASPKGFIGFISPSIMLDRKNEILKNKDNGKLITPEDKKFLEEFDENSNPYLVVFNFNE